MESFSHKEKDKFQSNWCTLMWIGGWILGIVAICITIAHTYPEITTQLFARAFKPKLNTIQVQEPSQPKYPLVLISQQNMTDAPDVYWCGGLVLSDKDGHVYLNEGYKLTDASEWNWGAPPKRKLEYYSHLCRRLKPRTTSNETITFNKSAIIQFIGD